MTGTWSSQWPGEHIQFEKNNAHGCLAVRSNSRRRNLAVAAMLVAASLHVSSVRVCDGGAIVLS